MRGKSIFLAALLVCSVLAGGVAMTGAAVAQTSTDTPTPTATDTTTAGNEPLAEDTLTVDNDTQAVRALAENATGVLDVTVYGVDENGTETQVATGSLDATANTTDVYEYSTLDPATYGEYRVVVDGDAAADTLEIAKVQVVSGGGGLIGGLPGGTNLLAGLGAVLLIGAVAGAAVYTGRV